ncbi:MAG: hypothetical protein ACXW2E_00665 [Nitrososphaeraceae archaeon]
MLGIFTVVTILNIIGLSWMLWLEYQRQQELTVGSILYTIGYIIASFIPVINLLVGAMIISVLDEQLGNKSIFKKFKR